MGVAIHRDQAESGEPAEHDAGEEDQGGEHHRVAELLVRVRIQVFVDSEREHRQNAKNGPAEVHQIGELHAFTLRPGALPARECFYPKWVSRSWIFFQGMAYS